MPEWKRLADSPNDADLDVVFLHGLGGDGMDTWICPSDGRPWARWLAPDYPRAAFWFVDYGASPTKFGPSMGVRDRTVSLLESLRVKRIGKRPMVMVCHSLGGILLKSMVEYCRVRQDQYASAMDQLVGVAFLATPHRGASIVNIGKLVTAPLLSGLVSDLSRNHQNLLELNDRYNEIVAERQQAQRPIHHMAYFETQRYKFGPFRTAIVVDRDSANPGIQGCSPVPVDADHVTICKRPGRDDDVVVGIGRLIEQCAQGPQSPGRPAAASVATRPPAPVIQSTARARLRRELQALAGDPSTADDDFGDGPEDHVSQWLVSDGPLPNVDALLGWVQTRAQSVHRPVNVARWKQLHATAAAEADPPTPESPAVPAVPAPTEPLDDCPLSPGDGDPWQSVWAAHVGWLHRSLLADVVPLRMIIGGVDSGKTTFFRGLTERQPHREAGTTYAYWDLAELRRPQTSKSFWKALADKLQLPSIDHRDPVRGLSVALRGTAAGRHLVIVFDHWDDAVLDGGLVDGSEWTRLESAIHAQQARTGETARLGALFVTRQPTRRSYVRASRVTSGRQGVRMSGLLSGKQPPLSFPMLDDGATRQVLRGLGVAPDVARQLAADCGGWLGLLACAADQVGLSAEWHDWARASVRRDLVVMLEKSLLRAIEAEFGTASKAQSWVKVLEALEQGAQPLDFGLPAGLGAWGLPPLFDGILTGADA